MWHTLSHAVFAVHTETHGGTHLSKQTMCCIHKHRGRKALTELCEKFTLPPAA